MPRISRDASGMTNTEQTTVSSHSIQTTPARVLNRGTGTVPPVTAPGLPTIEVRLGAEDAAGFSMVEYEVPARFSPPPHLHRHTRENAVAYILTGHLHYWFDDHDVVVGPGAVVHLPSGAWFRWANDSGEIARMLCMFSPAGFEQFFVDVMQEAAAAGGDLGRVIGPLRARYGDEDRPEAPHSFPDPHPSAQPPSTENADAIPR